jgi:hypothetical protein
MKTLAEYNANATPESYRYGWTAPTGAYHQAWECRDCGAFRIVDVPDDITDEDEEE